MEDDAEEGLPSRIADPTETQAMVSNEAQSIEDEMIRHAILESMRTASEKEGSGSISDASEEEQERTTGSEALATTSTRRIPSLPLGTPWERIGSLPTDDGTTEDLLSRADREEAAMLEAVMLGVPYRGDVGRRPDIPPSPSTIHRQSLRNEQDEAYEASLALDRRKEEEARMKVEEEERLIQEKNRMEEERKMLLARKAEVLPEEPEEGTEGIVACVVRLPDGRRVARKFLRVHPVSHLFDWVDLQEQVHPSTYRLIAQYPKRVLVSNPQRTLADSEVLGPQEVFYVEMM